MTNLLDIVPAVKEVETAKYGKLTIHGLSFSGIAYLVKNHPEIMELFDGKSDLELNIDTIVDLGTDIVASFLAAGLGYPGDAKALEMCRAMNPEDAWTVGSAILDESFPGGAANFFQRITKATKDLNLAQINK